jgi:hypothetical protein
MTLLAAIVENVYEIRALVGCVYVTGGIAGGVYGGRHSGACLCQLRGKAAL